MTDPAVDVHEQHHDTLDVEPLPHGFALLYSQIPSGAHWQLVLTHGEQPGERVACWLGDDLPADERGVPVEDVPGIVAHIVHHVLHRIPPNQCE